MVKFGPIQRKVVISSLRKGFFAICTSFLGSNPMAANELSLSTFGHTGLVEMPNARTLSDGELAISSSYTGRSLRSTVTFQVSPRLSSSFRYSIIDDFFTGGRDLYDRSFDLRYQISEETGALPAIVVGINDFVGTGLYTGEFIVGTKEILPGVDVTAGLGWGRFAGLNSFENPLAFAGLRGSEREFSFSGRGGQIEFGRFFQGPTSFFGGLDYRVNDSFSLQLEYSPDLYTQERGAEFESAWLPFNAAVNYSFSPSVSAKGYLVGGSEIGFQLTFALNPKAGIVPGGSEPGPDPIVDRNELLSSNWIVAGQEETRDEVRSRLSASGLHLEDLQLDRNSVTVVVENNRWGVAAQAAGRAARVMANTLPPQIEDLTVIFQERGVPISAVITKRSDLEDLQYDYDAAWLTQARADVDDAGQRGVGDPTLDYSIRPYAAFSFFDPQSPIRADFGPQLDLSYQAAPGLTFDGKFRYPLAGNLGDAVRESDSPIPRVRSESFMFARESEFEINLLSAEYIWRPAKDIFARISVGYLESQFGGVSSEVLWYPIDSRFAFGSELNYTRQRDFDMLLGFQDYDVFTGHVSAYYDLGNGFHTQVDLGRYLAGDWGGTLTVNREFNNGVKIGGYFTLTDVAFDDFGEGSFDKGLRFEVPLAFFTGSPSRRILTQTIQPIQRDGGARLNVDNRLYPLTRDYRGVELADGWARYLR